MIKRRYRRLKDFHRLYNLIKKGGFADHHIIELGRTSEMVGTAQRLHASVYLSRSFISLDDIGPDGRLKHDVDPHQKHAHYFAAAIKENGRGRIVATARQIECTPSKGMSSFPILEKAKIYKRISVQLEDVDPKKCIEISALAKQRGASSAAPLLLYREMWRRSLNEGHDLWLMACDVRLFERLELLFGKSIQQIGRRTSYQGGDVIPALLRINTSFPELIKTTKKSRFRARAFRKKILRFMYEAYPRHLLTEQDSHELKKLKITR